MTSSHGFLRRETRALHERTEAAFARFDLTQTEGYAGFLQAQAGALIALEAALDDAGAARLMPDWPARRRAGDLREDLAALKRAIPPTLAVPSFANDGEVMGALYVLEGSKLGARFLLARLAGNPALAGATQFLSSGDAPERKGQWPAFLAVLDAAPYDSADLLAGASRAFSLFERAAADSVKA